MTPRFEWRGAMLDVARHFFPVEDVQRFVDAIERLRLNRLHLHLTDDQGWRLEIRSRPKLTGGGPFYTQQEYRQLVAYAAERGVVLVPEIDVPGHVNAALVAYPELAPPGYDPQPYTGTDVGFSTLDVENEETYRFLDDVIGEVAALTPCPYLHIGGDESDATPHDGYVVFVGRALAIVRTHGKQPVGWEEVAQADLPAATIVQHWKRPELAREAVRKGAKLIMSPATRTYFDQKYDATTELGLEWAGHISVEDAADWDPATFVDGVGENDILGVEGCLWSETLSSYDDLEFMAFPRLDALAEIASRTRDASSS